MSEIENTLTGRAPIGGCVAFGEFYEGGQFLPIHRDAALGGVRPLSPAQADAAAAKAARIQTDRERSTFVGVVGARIKKTLTVAVVLVSNGFYGPSYFTIARDEAGCVFVSRGSRWASEGDTVAVTCTVKEHSSYEGVAQTVVKNVRVGK